MPKLNCNLGIVLFAIIALPSSASVAWEITPSQAFLAPGASNSCLWLVENVEPGLARHGMTGSGDRQHGRDGDDVLWSAVQAFQARRIYVPDDIRGKMRRRESIERGN